MSKELCDCVISDPGEGLHDLGTCHLPAGHEGNHEVIYDVPRSEYDRKPDGTPPSPAKT